MKKICKLIVLGSVLSCFSFSPTFAVHFQSLMKQNCSNQSAKSYKIPFRVYRLIKTDKGVPAKYSNEMTKIIETFWNEPNGRLILDTLSKNKVKIKIVNSDGRAFTSEQEVSISYSPSTANQGDIYKLFYITVAVPTGFIDNYENKNLSSEERLYSLGYMLHELAHAFVYVKEPHNVNSVEQKLTLTMFGYNEANKLMTGEYLSKEQSTEYSYKALKSIIDYETKKCPTYTGITNRIQNYGLNLQYPQDYSNIKAMYKKMVSDGQIKHNHALKFN